MKHIGFGWSYEDFGELKRCYYKGECFAEVETLGNPYTSVGPFHAVIVNRGETIAYLVNVKSGKPEGFVAGKGVVVPLTWDTFLILSMWGDITERAELILFAKGEEKVLDVYEYKKHRFPFAFSPKVLKEGDKYKLLCLRGFCYLRPNYPQRGIHLLGDIDLCSLELDTDKPSFSITKIKKKKNKKDYQCCWKCWDNEIHDAQDSKNLYSAYPELLKLEEMGYEFALPKSNPFYLFEPSVNPEFLELLRRIPR